VLRLRALYLPMPESELEALQRQIWCYPGLCPGFRKLLVESSLPVAPVETLIEVRVFRGRDEYKTKVGEHLGIPLELSCLAYLAQTGSWGISVQRLKALLWPDEPFAWDELDSRLTTLLSRIRRRFPRAKIHQAMGRILIPSELPWLYLEPVPEGVAWPRFLDLNREFGSADLTRSFVRMAKSRATEILRSWIQRGWIESIGKGRSIRYRTLV
ncbi:MAG: hypothetical protein AAB425_02355, partial [Bdellovibrionota bacterium]